jgi:hypothetical protein
LAGLRHDPAREQWLLSNVPNAFLIPFGTESQDQAIPYGHFEVAWHQHIRYMIPYRIRDENTKTPVSD